MSAPLCALCGRRASVYVCQNCGRTVCAGCFDSAHWSCVECQARLQPSPQTIGSTMASPFTWATWLFFAAFAIIFVGILLMTVGSLSNLKLSSTGGGAILLIGPIPIILGTGQNSLAIIALGVFLTVFALLFFFLLRKKS